MVTQSEIKIKQFSNKKQITRILTNILAHLKTPCSIFLLTPHIQNVHISGFNKAIGYSSFRIETLKGIKKAR